MPSRLEDGFSHCYLNKIELRHGAVVLICLRAMTQSVQDPRTATHHGLWCPSLQIFVVTRLSQHQGLFQWVGSSHQVAKVLELQLQHHFFQWIEGLTSFRIDWLDLLAVQGALKSLLQHHSSKASVLWHSVFFFRPALISIHDYWKNHSFD